jgi:AraC family transcriptional activator of pobA
MRAHVEVSFCNRWVARFRASLCTANKRFPSQRPIPCTLRIFSRAAASTCGGLGLIGTRFFANGPAVMIIPAGTIHSFRFRPDTQGYVLTVNLQRLLSIASGALRAPIEALFAVPRAIDLGLKSSLAARASQQLECLLHEFRQPDVGMEPIQSWLACCVLWTVAHGSSAAKPETHSGPDLERLRQFRALMETHYADHWPVERYARQLGLSETSLNRLCRRLTGSTGFDLIQQRLALEARRRLMYLPSSVHGIASELGFKDSAYFCRFFRRHSGMSPKGFRRRHAGG